MRVGPDTEVRGRGLATAATRALSAWTFATLAPPRLAVPGDIASRTDDGGPTDQAYIHVFRFPPPCDQWCHPTWS